LLPNEEYAPLGRYLADPKTPAGVLAVLMADVLNRPNALKLPLLLEVARNPDHAKAADAKNVLELYFEHDYGADWNAWQARMQDWLKNNPD
jgi:RecJ-like exonuclease